MPGESVIFDPTSENPANAQVDVNDQVSYFLLEHDYPLPDIDALYASSADTEGEIPVSNRDKNRIVTGKVRVVGASALDLDQKIDAIAQKIGKFKREGGTLKRTSPSGVVGVFDVLPESSFGATYDKHYITRQKTEIDYKLVCSPYVRGPAVDTIADSFATDSIGAGWYTFDAGAGTLSVATAQMAPSSTAEKRLYRSVENLVCPDAQETYKIVTGASVASGLAQVILRRVDASNYLRLGVNFAGAASTLTLEKVAAGAATQLGAASATFTTVAATTYWLRCRCEGNLLTAEWWTAQPTATGSPAQTLTYTLAGADVAARGLGISGSVGLRLVPAGTDYRYDDVEILPYCYVERTNPILVTPPIYGIKGDVPALARLVVTELAGQDQWWAIFGDESRYFSPGVPTLLDQFGSDTIGSGAWSVANGTVSITGGLLVPGATTEIRMHRSDSAAYTDTRSVVKTTTGASVASGSTALGARRSADTDFLFARLNCAGAASTLTLHKRAAAADSAALATSAAFTTAAATSYWLEFIVQGTKLTVNAYAADPATGAAIITGATATYTLSLAEAAQFTTGACGLKLVPQATDWRWDDFRVFPLQGCTEALIDSEALLTSGYSGVQATRTAAFSGGTVANSVIRHTLANAYAASCAIAPQGHVGWYRVFARLYRPTTNTGAVSVALEWGTGDFLRVQRNDEVAFAAGERQGDFTITDLGSVQIRPATKGTQQWRGQVIAKSTVLSDVLDIDYLFLVPYAEGSGEAVATASIQTATAFSARDEFNQAPGNLNGVALPAGGAWSTTGADVTDLAVDTGTHTAKRSTATDVSGKIAIAGSATFTHTLMQVDVDWDFLAASVPVLSAIARYVDASNHLRVDLVTTTGARQLQIVKVVAGAASTLATVALGDTEVYPTPPANGQKWSIRVLVFAGGQVFATIFPGASTSGSAPGSTPTVWRLAAFDAVLAPGGALASGKVGFKDINTGVATSRYYDNFWAAVPVPDAALFSGRQMEFRSDSVLRQDPTGAGPWPVSDDPGDFPKLIPAGRENRQNRLVVDTSRNDPSTMTDPSLSKTQLQVANTPRYLSLPAG